MFSARVVDRGAGGTRGLPCFESLWCSRLCYDCYHESDQTMNEFRTYGVTVVGVVGRGGRQKGGGCWVRSSSDSASRYLLYWGEGSEVEGPE